MTGLSLPADAEVFIPEGKDVSHLSTAGVYALTLSKPPDLAAAWDRTFEHRPDYWADLVDCETCVYVGAAKNVLKRLTQHKQGKIKRANLVRVCNIESLRNIWWVDDPERRFIVESQTALSMQAQYPAYYVHSR